jgi:hypothetical protein
MEWYVLTLKYWQFPILKHAMQFLDVAMVISPLVSMTDNWWSKQKLWNSCHSIACLRIENFQQYFFFLANYPKERAFQILVVFILYLLLYHSPIYFM